MPRFTLYWLNDAETPVESEIVVERATVPEKPPRLVTVIVDLLERLTTVVTLGGAVILKSTT